MPVGKTGLLIDERFLNHVTPPGHPERADRMDRLLGHRRLFESAGIVRMKAGREASHEEMTRVHEPGYVEHIASTRGQRYIMLDSDTHASEKSYETALLAAGGVIEMVDAVLRGEVDNGMALVRPPGHHAEAGRAMGFCLFNNVAVGARYLTEAHGVERVLVVDWDVHHGNGTQRSFYEDRGVLFVSLHQYPYYPGTGSAHELGHGDGEGFTVNVPLPAGCGDAEYLDAFREVVAPIAMQYEPQFVLVSAGFDAHRDDPLGGMRVTEAGYAEMTSIVLDVARECSDGRCVAVLEGGYNLDALAASVEATATTMSAASASGEGTIEAPSGGQPSDLISPIRRVHSEYWEL